MERQSWSLNHEEKHIVILLTLEQNQRICSDVIHIEVLLLDCDVWKEGDVEEKTISDEL